MTYRHELGAHDIGWVVRLKVSLAHGTCNTKEGITMPTFARIFTVREDGRQT